jgi:hypothetical protein
VRLSEPSLLIKQLACHSDAIVECFTVTAPEADSYRNWL